MAALYLDTLGLTRTSNLARKVPCYRCVRRLRKEEKILLGLSRTGTSSLSSELDVHSVTKLVEHVLAGARYPDSSVDLTCAVVDSQKAGHVLIA